MALNMKIERRRNQKGQALIEVVLLLPVLLMIVTWTFSAYRGLRAAQVGQRAAYFHAMNQLDNRHSALIDATSGPPGTRYTIQGDAARPFSRQAYIAIQNQPSGDNAQPIQGSHYLFRIESLAAPYTTASGVCFRDDGNGCRGGPSP